MGETRSQMAEWGKTKILVTVFLTLQVACMVLVLRYSMVTTTYIKPTAVLMGEVVKLCTSLIGMAIIGFTTGNPSASIKGDIIAAFEPHSLMLMSIPAILYLVQNNLLFFAMANVDAGLYQVTYQLKTLTTAGCSVVMLNKAFTQKQWIALLVLSIGVSICQYKPSESSQVAPGEDKVSGMLALIAACFTSSIAGVYTEKMLKQSTVSLWSRNVQLAFWSILTGGVALFMSGDGTKIIEGGLFQGYTPVVWLVVLLQGATGILVALVMKYADNIVKNFSVAMATVIATIASIPLFGTWPTTFFVIGMSLVFVSMWIYATNGATTSAGPAKVETDSDSQKLLQDMESGHVTHSEKSTK